MKCLAVLLVAATVPLAYADAAPRPVFKASATVDQNDCASSGVVVFVNATVKGDRKAANAARKKYAPRGKGTFTIGGRSYVVTPDRNLDFAGKGFASWGFKPIPLSDAAKEAMIGKRGTVSYGTRGGKLSLKAKAFPAECG